MAAAERRRGRRDNGLDATDWRAIDDLDPRLVDEVLDLLATRGIAAYVQPTMDIDPITRSATVPDRPTDRLYVDRNQVAAARECLRALRERRRNDTGAGPSDHDSGVGTERTDSDLDSAFAGIVAGFNQPVDPDSAPWPAAENLPAGPESTPQRAEPPTPVRRAGKPVDARDLTEPSLLDALDTFGAHLPDEEPPERFIPPPPPPLPRLSRQAVFGAGAIVLGLLLLLSRPSVLPFDRTTLILVGFASVCGGAVALIMRLRPGSDPDDFRGDDGAQV